MLCFAATLKVHRIAYRQSVQFYSVVLSRQHMHERKRLCIVHPIKPFARETSNVNKSQKTQKHVWGRGARQSLSAFALVICSKQILSAGYCNTFPRYLNQRKRACQSTEVWSASRFEQHRSGNQWVHYIIMLTIDPKLPVRRRFGPLLAAFCTEWINHGWVPDTFPHTQSFAQKTKPVVVLWLHLRKAPPCPATYRYLSRAKQEFGQANPPSQIEAKSTSDHQIGIDLVEALGR